MKKIKGKGKKPYNRYFRNGVRIVGLEIEEPARDLLNEEKLKNENYTNVIMRLIEENHDYKERFGKP
jgi:hypothetical protein